MSVVERWRAGACVAARAIFAALAFALAHKMFFGLVI